MLVTRETFTLQDNDLGLSETDILKSLETFKPKKTIYTRRDKVKSIRILFQQCILQLVKKGDDAKEDNALKQNFQAVLSGYFNQIMDPVQRAITIGVLAIYDLTSMEITDSQQSFKKIFSRMDSILRNMIEYGPDSDTAAQDQELLLRILTILSAYPTAKNRHKELLLTIFKLQPKPEESVTGKKTAFVKQANILLEQAKKLLKVWQVEHSDYQILAQLKTIYSRLEESKDIGALTISSVSGAMLKLITHIEKGHVPVDTSIDEIFAKSLNVIEILTSLFVQGKESVEIFEATVLLQRIEGISQQTWETLDEEASKRNLFIVESSIHHSAIRSYLQQLSLHSQQIPSTILKIALESLKHLTQSLKYEDFAKSIEMVELLIQPCIDETKALKPETLKLLLQWEEVIARALLTIGESSHYDNQMVLDIGDKLQLCINEQNLIYINDGVHNYKRKITPLKAVISNQIHLLPAYLKVIDAWKSQCHQVKDVHKLRYELLFIQEQSTASDLTAISELSTGLLTLGESLDINAALPEEDAELLVTGFSTLMDMLDAIVSDQVIHIASKELINELFKGKHQDHEKLDDTFVAKSSQPVADEQESEMGELSGDIDSDLSNGFIHEAKKWTIELDSVINDWYAKPHLIRIADQVMRILHNLKSGASLANYHKLKKLIHRLELYILDQITLHTIDIAFFTNFRTQFEIIQNEIERIINRNNENVIQDSGASKTPEVTTLPDNNLENNAPAKSKISSKVDIDSIQKTIPQQAHQNLVEAPPLLEPDSVIPPKDKVQIGIDQLNDLIDTLSESTISRGQIAQQIGAIDDAVSEYDITRERLKTLILTMQKWNHRDDLPTELHSHISQFSEASQDLDILHFILEQSVKNSKSLLKENANLLGELNLKLARSRTLSFNTVISNLETLVERTATLNFKNVKLQFLNADTDIDRHLLQGVAKPLEHLLRNAVIHGIEDRETRLRLGKALNGKLIVSVENNGASITIKVLDDGMGFDINAICQRALDMGIVQQHQVQKMDDASIANLAFHRGLSTVTEVEEDTGNGLGLHAVKNQVQGIGGKVRLETLANQGSQFYIELPAAFTPVRAMVASIGPQKFVLPLNHIQVIEQARASQLGKAYENSYQKISINARQYRYCYLGELLEIAWKPSLELLESQNQSLLLYQFLDENYAVHVNQVEGVQDMIVSPLPKYFDNIDAFIGVTILNDGSTAMVLNIQPLLTKHIAIEAPHNTVNPNNTSLTVQNDTASIIFVDDSLSVRKKASAALKKHGYNVRVARNGIDALRLIHEKNPNLLIVDSNMPKMNGFDLLSILNNHDRFDNMVKVLCSESVTHVITEKCKKLKVTHLLEKPYNEEKLIEIVESFV